MKQTVALFALLVAAIALPLSDTRAASLAHAQAVRTDIDFASQTRINSVARLMAGLPPSYAEHQGIAQNPAWKEHSEATQAMWESLRSGRAAAMTAFGKKELPSSCPVGKTLLYPFSGPDFFNAWWLFPGCENIVMFGLEHIGQVPRLETLNERELIQFMKDLRDANADLLDRNYFITSHMSRQLHTSQLRGVLPMIMTSMALSGLEILSITPRTLVPLVDAADTADAEKQAKLKSMRKPQGVTVEFRTADSRVVRRLTYFSVDVSDRSMAVYPEFLEYLRGLGTTSTLVKSGSYLLHAREFSRLRATLLSISGFLVQDDTGFPYKTLLASGWDMSLRGMYSMPIPPFEYAYQPALQAAFEQERPAPLAFDFGYRFRDSKTGQSMMMIGRRATSTKVLGSSARMAVSTATAPLK